MLAVGRDAHHAAIRRLSVASDRTVMVGITTIVQSVLIGATCTLARVNYPAIPRDVTTPVQQRLAVYGPNGMNGLDV